MFGQLSTLLPTEQAENDMFGQLDVGYGNDGIVSDVNFHDSFKFQ